MFTCILSSPTLLLLLSLVVEQIARGWHGIPVHRHPIRLCGKRRTARQRHRSRSGSFMTKRTKRAWRCLGWLGIWWLDPRRRPSTGEITCRCVYTYLDKFPYLCIRLRLGAIRYQSRQGAETDGTRGHLDPFHRQVFFT